MFQGILTRSLETDCFLPREVRWATSNWTLALGLFLNDLPSLDNDLGPFVHKLTSSTTPWILNLSFRIFQPGTAFDWPPRTNLSTSSSCCAYTCLKLITPGPSGTMNKCKCLACLNRTDWGYYIFSTMTPHTHPIFELKFKCKSNFCCLRGQANLQAKPHKISFMHRMLTISVYLQSYSLLLVDGQWRNYWIIMDEPKFCLANLNLSWHRVWPTS